MLYPERVYHPKFNQKPIIKPLIQDEKPTGKEIRFMRFGNNLGPKNPIIPKTKYAEKQAIYQSPAMRIQKPTVDVSSAYIVDHTKAVQ